MDKAEEAKKIDQYREEIDRIVADPSFGKFLKDNLFHIMAKTVVAYGIFTLNRFTKRTGMSASLVTQQSYLIALGYYLGKRGVLD